MKALVVTDQAAGTAGVKLVERPDPQAAINDVVVQIHASGFTGDELTWPSTWTDRVGTSGNVPSARCIDGIDSMAQGQKYIELRRHNFVCPQRGAL